MRYFALLALLLLLAGPVQAISFEDPSTSLGLGTADLKSTTINIVNWALGLLGILAVVFFLLGAADTLIRGKSDKVVQTWANRAMVASLIGLVVIVLAWAIVNFVIKTTSNVTGVS